MIDEYAAVRKIQGRQGAFWVIDSYKTGIAINATGCKTRKAAIEYYEENLKGRVSRILDNEKYLADMIEQVQSAPTETELSTYKEIDVITLYDWRYDKLMQAAKKHGCIIKPVKEESYLQGGHFKVYGSENMMQDVKDLMERFAKRDEEKEQAEMEKNAIVINSEINEDRADSAVVNTGNAEENEIDVSILTPENIADYLPALLMSLYNDKHNSGIIMAAGIDAGVIPPEALIDYFQRGIMPRVHTFDIWEKEGFTVKKGEKAAFSAYIWKHIEKTETLTEERAASINACMVNADGSNLVNAGDEVTHGSFIRKIAYFFTPAQVEKLETLPDLPEDVKKEKRGSCVWISGNTRPIKDALKKAGFKWSKKNSAWYRREAA